MRVKGGGIVTGTPAEYNLVSFHPSGQVLDQFGRRDLRPERRTPEERRELRDKFRRTFQGALPKAQEEELYAQAADQPKPFFATNAFATDSAGRIWVATDRGNGNTTAVDVFSATGELEATLTFRDRVIKLAPRLPFVAVLVERRGGTSDGQSGVDVYRIAER
ncbi:MAG TPA: hypothetical protein VEY93_16680 [Longimicrobium sp.]|nr:hypothetical protein [Longimicrobium sp.]